MFIVNGWPDIFDFERATAILFHIIAKDYIRGFNSESIDAAILREHIIPGADGNSIARLKFVRIRRHELSTTLEKDIKGKRRGRNGLEFGLLKHGGGIIIAVGGEQIDGEAMIPFPDSFIDGKRFTAIPFHFYGKTFRDSDHSPFIQTKLSNHIVPLTDCDLITNVVGEIIGRIEMVH